MMLNSLFLLSFLLGFSQAGSSKFASLGKQYDAIVCPLFRSLCHSYNYKDCWNPKLNVPPQSQGLPWTETCSMENGHYLLECSHLACGPKNHSASSAKKLFQQIKEMVKPNRVELEVTHRFSSGEAYCQTLTRDCPLCTDDTDPIRVNQCQVLKPRGRKDKVKVQFQCQTKKGSNCAAIIDQIYQNYALQN